MAYNYHVQQIEELLRSYLNDDRFVKIVFRKSCGYRFLNLFNKDNLTCSELYDFISGYNNIDKNKFKLMSENRELPDDDRLFHNQKLEWNMKSIEGYNYHGAYYLIDIYISNC